jgi:hypothetical protein
MGKSLVTAMIKKSFIATISILFLVSSVLAEMQVEVVDANPLPWAFDPQMTVTIKSPANGTINSLPVLVSFTSQSDWQFSVSDDPSEEWVTSFFYVLDGQNMRSMGMRFVGTQNTTISEQGSKYDYNFSGQAYLTNLADGPHTITVYYGAVNKISYVGTPQEHVSYNTAWQATSQFYVQNKLTPSPTPTPTVPEFPFIIVTAIILAVLTLAVSVFKRKIH